MSVCLVIAVCVWLVVLGLAAGYSDNGYDE